MRNITFEFAVFLAEIFPKAGILREPFEEIEGGRDDYRLSVFRKFTTAWSREQLEIFQSSFFDELGPTANILSQKQLVRSMFVQDLTLGRALVLCLGLDARTALEDIPGQYQLEIMVALAYLTSVGPWEAASESQHDFDIKLGRGEFTNVDEVLVLLAGTEFPVNENVRLCWKRIRGLQMPGRAHEPFFAEEVIEKLFIDDANELERASSDRVEELEALVEILKAKIATLEDQQPKPRTSLEKIALGLAIHRAGYDPRVIRQDAVKNIVTWLEVVGLSIDPKTVRARLAHAYQCHADDVDEFLRDEK